MSDDADTTYQLFEVTFGAGTLRLCNVYCVPGGLLTTLLPPPAAHGMLYLRDFNARHLELGDASPVGNRSGRRLLQYILCNHLTHWPPEGQLIHAEGPLITPSRLSWWLPTLSALLFLAFSPIMFQV